MRNVLIETEASMRFNDAVDEVVNGDDGDTGFILAVGQAGRGKSSTARSYFYRSGGALLAVWENMSQAAFLHHLLFEVRGQNTKFPSGSSDKCKREIIQILKDKDRRMPLFIDEAERLSRGRIEDLRDIHIATNAPIILIGEEGLYGALAEMRRHWSRVVDEIAFGPINAAEVNIFARQAAELTIPPDLCRVISERAEGDFRLVRNMVRGLEKTARAAENLTVDRGMLDTVLSSRSWRRA